MVLDEIYHVDGGLPPAGAEEAEPTPMPPDDFDDGWQDAPPPAEALVKSKPVPARAAATPN
jgi:hypothetical protein